jgi:hypothetical protein
MIKLSELGSKLEIKVTTTTQITKLNQPNLLEWALQEKNEKRFVCLNIIITILPIN